MRCHLHFITGRAEERLTFDLQPELAKRMGYRARGNETAVERFMRRYFLAAKEVGALTRMLVRQARSRPRQARAAVVAALLAGGKAADDPSDAEGFRVDGGRLDVDPSLRCWTSRRT